VNVVKKDKYLFSIRSWNIPAVAELLLVSQEWYYMGLVIVLDNN
jgi:hypothetical protein